MLMVKLFDNQLNRVITRRSADAREIVGRDPARYSFADQRSKLKPIIHEPRADEEGEPEPVTAATPVAAKEASPSAPAKKRPSQATIEKRRAALAKGRATAAANRAAKVQAQPTA